MIFNALAANSPHKTGLLFRKIDPEIRRQILLTSPLVALLLTIPLCIVYRADAVDYPRVFMNLLLGVWVTWMVNIWVPRIPAFSRLGWISSILVNQVVLFLIGLFLLFGVGILEIVELFTKGQAITLMSFVSLALNLVVHTNYELIRSKEEWMKLHVENSALRYAKLQAEFQMLKEQINPHFLFNALNTSKSLVREDPDGAERYIIHLSDFLRSTIQQHEMMVSLAEEMAMCHNYMELQRIRFGKALQIHQDVDREQLKKRLPYFTLTTLVENAIKHNALTIQDPVTIRIFSEDDHIVVVNNVRSRIHAETTRTGLANLDERCRLLTGVGINVRNVDEHYRVSIKLTPL